MASFGTPLIALIALLSWGSLVPWHNTTLACLAAVMLLAWPTVYLRMRLGFGEPAPTSVFAGLLVVQTVLLLSTGGLNSPLILPLIPQAMMMGFVAPTSLRYPPAGLITIVLVLLLAEQVEPLREALLEPALGSGHSGLGSAIYGGLLCFILFAGNRAGRKARDTVAKAHLEVQRLQRAQIDDLNRGQRAQFTLTSTLAHELKNPLTTLLALSTHLQRLAEPDGHQEELDAMVEEIRRMRTGVDGLLDISRPQGDLTIAPVELLALCAEVATSHRALGRAHQIRLRVQGPATPILADAFRLRQVLQNLVQNAIQASGPDTEVILQTLVDAEQVRVRVLDRGAGLPPEHGDQVFLPGITTKPTGTGIGLPVSRAIARQHGGDLTLKARDGGGCQAELRLPKRPRVAPIS